MVTGGWITQADRSRWQQRAAAELAVILAAHPGIPVIAWTVTASGGALLRIPIESDHLFRSNPIADSGVSDHLAGVGVS